MMTPAAGEAYISEIQFVRDAECLSTIRSIRALLAATNVEEEMIRLMSVPMLYSVWERAFSNWTAISLRVLREVYSTAAACPPQSRAFWLRKASFFKSFVDAVRDVVELEREDSIFQQNTGFSKKITKGAFVLSSQVLAKLDEWHSKPLALQGDMSELVITYSNVNENVLTLNADAIGLNSTVAYQTLDKSRLGQLVGIRNGIGHGASLQAPGVRELNELIDYTEMLVNQYAEVTIEWINIHIERAG